MILLLDLENKVTELFRENTSLKIEFDLEKVKYLVNRIQIRLSKLNKPRRFNTIFATSLYLSNRKISQMSVCDILNDIGIKIRYPIITATIKTLKLEKIYDLTNNVHSFARNSREMVCHDLVNLTQKEQKKELDKMFWMYETTGRMKKIVLRYFDDLELEKEDFGILKNYVIQWIDNACIIKPNGDYRTKILKMNQSEFKKYVNEDLLSLDIDPF